ncbi:MAG: polysaccharide deacetylase family protein [Spirochaetales bacterium]|nr:polysaccharide deacetylase family protein [Spirochaetales bacterium]
MGNRKNDRAGQNEDQTASRLYPGADITLYPKPEVSITRWYGDAKAACSLTFDDGTLDHYLAAFPIMEEYNLKGTFFLMVKGRESGIWNDYGSERQLMSWKQAGQMGRAGHEIGSHSVNHLDLRATEKKEDGIDILNHEFYGSREEIEKNTNSKITAFAWPYFRYTEYSQEKILDHYMVARTGSIYPSKITDIPASNLVSPPNPGAIPSYALLSNQEISEWESLATDVYSKGGWLSLCLHGIEKEGIPKEALGWEAIPEKDFRSILNYISRKEIWAAPFGTVYQYIHQRDNTDIEIIKFTETSLVIDLSFPMEYTARPVPITLAINLPFDWNGRIYSADGTVIILYRDDSRILADLIPHPPSEKGRYTYGF